MIASAWRRLTGGWMLVLGIWLASSGCHAIRHRSAGPPVNIIPPYSDAPRELSKMTLPAYTIEPPDILTIDAIRVVPRPPYHVNTLDVLVVQASGTLPEAPIGGPYTVEPGGTINLGVPYGVVKVVGSTLDEITVLLMEHLKQHVREPQVSVTLGSVAGEQQIAGEHLVSPDGTVTLGAYGSVYVVGLTLAEAKQAIEGHLAQHLEDPEVALNVFAYNSKVYYVITQGAGLGDGVTRFPITGNETVLDAISQINGLTQVSSKKIWIARPTPGFDQDQILPVDWNAITARGSAATNYQILPGDRLFVAQDHLIALDTALGKIMAPAERLFGFTLLGTSTVSSLRFFNSQGRTGGVGGVGF